jgi:hypothetical protein
MNGLFRASIVVVFLAAIMPSCSYTLHHFQGGKRSIKSGAWEWGNIEPGSKLRCKEMQEERVFVDGDGRLFDPFGTASYGKRLSIRKGEILRVVKLFEDSTGNFTVYNLKLVDQQGKPVTISVAGSNNQIGSRFTKKALARIGFQMKDE